MTVLTASEKTCKKYGLGFRHGIDMTNKKWEVCTTTEDKLIKLFNEDKIVKVETKELVDIESGMGGSMEDIYFTFNDKKTLKTDFMIDINHPSLSSYYRTFEDLFERQYRTIPPSDKQREKMLKKGKLFYWSNEIFTKLPLDKKTIKKERVELFTK